MISNAKTESNAPITRNLFTNKDELFNTSITPSLKEKVKIMRLTKGNRFLKIGFLKIDKWETP